jgi:predicted RNA-binding protein with PIN domain
VSLHIVIDGYNLIRQSRLLSAIEQNSLEEGREALIERLVSYRKIKHYPVTVIFDGAQADSLGGNRSRWKGISIVFSRHGELADSVIKRLVAREGEGIVVVTSDRDVADFAAEHGAATIGSVEFEDKMRMATELDSVSSDFGNVEEAGWKPTTKKKGPSRRRSKRERRSRTRTRKL